MVTKFKNHLAKTNLAKNTVTSYVWTVNYFLTHYKEVNKKNLLAYKGYLVENFRPQTTARHQQVFGVYKAGQTESKVCQGSAEELSGKRNQRCRLQIFESTAKSGWL